MCISTIACESVSEIYSLGYKRYINIIPGLNYNSRHPAVPIRACILQSSTVSPHPRGAILIKYNPIVSFLYFLFSSCPVPKVKYKLSNNASYSLNGLAPAFLTSFTTHHWSILISKPVMLINVLIVIYYQSTIWIRIAGSTKILY